MLILLFFIKVACAQNTPSERLSEGGVSIGGGPNVRSFHGFWRNVPEHPKDTQAPGGLGIEAYSDAYLTNEAGGFYFKTDYGYHLIIMPFLNGPLIPSLSVGPALGGYLDLELGASAPTGAAISFDLSTSLGIDIPLGEQERWGGTMAVNLQLPLVDLINTTQMDTPALVMVQLGIYLPSRNENFKKISSKLPYF